MSAHVANDREATAAPIAALRSRAGGVLVLVLGIIALVWLGLDHRPLRGTLVLYPAIACAAGLPLAVAWWRLRAGRDAGAVALAQLGSLWLALALLSAWCLTIGLLLANAKEWALVLALSYLAIEPALLAAVVLTFVLAAAIVSLVRLGARVPSAHRATLTVPSLVLSAGALCLAPVGERVASTPPQAPYARAAALRQAAHVYRCLWQHAGPDTAQGFPHLLSEVVGQDYSCTAHREETGTGWRTRPGFVIEYEAHGDRGEGRYRGFALTIRDVTHRARDAEEIRLDQGGIVWVGHLREGRGPEAGILDSGALVTSAADCAPIVALRHDLEAYRRMFPEQGYPARLVPWRERGEWAPGDGTMATSYFGTAPVTATVDTTGRTRLSAASGTLTYQPWRGATAAMADYDIDVIMSDAGRVALDTGALGPALTGLRNFHVTRHAGAYATGAPRAATVRDPVAPACLE